MREKIRVTQKQKCKLQKEPKTRTLKKRHQNCRNEYILTNKKNEVYKSGQGKLKLHLPYQYEYINIQANIWQYKIEKVELLNENI